MQVLERIALLIKENPSITVQEIATRLGYSEEKSIYYWLEKSRYSGIKDFKKAVLVGEFRPDDIDSRVGAASTTREPETFRLYPTTDVPVITAFSPAGDPLYLEARRILDQAQPLSPGSFAFSLTTNDYAPLLLTGDLLLVDPLQTPGNGDLVMIWIPTTGVQVRRYHGTADRTFLLHPVTGRDLLDDVPAAQPRIIGRLLHAIRAL